MDGCWSGKARQLLELPRSLLPAQQLVQVLEQRWLVLVPEQQLEPELVQQQARRQLEQRLAWRLV